MHIRPTKSSPKGLQYFYMGLSVPETDKPFHPWVSETDSFIFWIWTSPLLQIRPPVDFTVNTGNWLPVHVP